MAWLYGVHRVWFLNSVECLNDNQKPVNQAGHVWRIFVWLSVKWCRLLTRQSTPLFYLISKYTKSAIYPLSSAIRKWNNHGVTGHY